MGCNICFEIKTEKLNCGNINCNKYYCKECLIICSNISNLCSFCRRYFSDFKFCDRCHQYEKNTLKINESDFKCIRCLNEISNNLLDEIDEFQMHLKYLNDLSDDEYIKDKLMFLKNININDIL